MTYIYTVPRSKVVRTMKKSLGRLNTSDQGPAFVPMQNDRLEQRSSTMDYYVRLADFALSRTNNVPKDEQK